MESSVRQGGFRHPLFHQANYLNYSLKRISRGGVKGLDRVHATDQTKIPLE